MKRRLQGRGITKGKAEGEAIVTKEPISFWGGLDRETGDIVDRNHELAGVNVKDPRLFPMARALPEVQGRSMPRPRKEQPPRRSSTLRQNRLSQQGRSWRGFLSWIGSTKIPFLRFKPVTMSGSMRTQGLFWSRKKT
jgi:hypothetical protein